MAYNSKAEIITFSANLIISYLLISTIGFRGAAIGMFVSQLLSKSYTNYITSITTFSTPHNGTSLSLIMDNHFPSLQKLAVYAGMMNNIFFRIDLF
mgnify:CR=1 FL=1